MDDILYALVLELMYGLWQRLTSKLWRGEATTYFEFGNLPKARPSHGHKLIIITKTNLCNSHFQFTSLWSSLCFGDPAVMGWVTLQNLCSISQYVLYSKCKKLNIYSMYYAASQFSESNIILTLCHYIWKFWRFQTLSLAKIIFSLLFHLLFNIFRYF